MNAAANPDFAIRIGSFKFYARTALLQDASGRDVHLRPQSAMVLAVLVRNSGTIVSKDTLIAEVWPHVSVTDDSLVQCIAEVRRALGDTARDRLKTYPKRGYKLVPQVQDDGPVEPDVDLAEIAQATGLVSLIVVQVDLPGAGAAEVRALCDASLAPLASPFLDVRGHSLRVGVSRANDAIALALKLTEDAQTFGRDMRVAIDSCRIPTPSKSAQTAPALTRLQGVATHAQAGQILATADVLDHVVDQVDCRMVDAGPVAVAGQSVSVFAVTRPDPGDRISARIAPADVLPTIAVIPMRAPDAGGDAIGDMFADDLIAYLSRSQEVNVVSRLSTRSFRQRDVDLSVLRTALNADYILSGSVVPRGDQALLKLELVDAASGNVLWADGLEVGVVDMLNDLSTVYRAANQIRQALAVSGMNAIRKHAFKDLKTYSLLFGAIGLMHRLNRPDFMMARRLLDVLVQRAPDQPTPLAWLARWHVLRLQQGWHEDARAEAQTALDYTRRALDLDPQNTLALTSEGMVLTTLWRKLDEAEICYDVALETNPNSANARILRGMLYSYQGLGDKAKRDAELALHLAPLDPHRFFFMALAAGANIAAGDYARALELSQQSLRMNRSHTSTLRGKIIALMGLGRDEEARASAAELMSLQPGFRVQAWLNTSPAGDFEIGTKIADTLRLAGIPD